MARRSVGGGFCNWPDTGGCALTKLGCDDPSNFRSVRQLQSGPVRAHGGSCRWQDSVRETVLGSCTTGGGLPTGCASEVEACPETDAERGFLGGVEGCTVESTSFGRCDYGTCAWSHRHCVEDNTWEAFDEECTCDKVLVGACTRRIGTGERESFCAVSEDACDDEQTWLAPQGVMQASGFDCYLCREDSPASSSSAASPASDPEAVAARGNGTKGGGGGTGGATTIVAVVALGAMVALSILGLVGWKTFRAKRAAKRSGDGAFAGDERDDDPPPATDIRIDDGAKGPGPSAHPDDASVLSDDD